MKILKVMHDWSTSDERKQLNSYGGCGYYRTKKVAENIEGHEVTVWNREWKDLADKYDNSDYGREQFYSKIAREYDLIWFHMSDNPIMFTWLRVACDKYGKKLVIDLDDNFLEVDKSNPAKKNQNLKKMDTSNKKTTLSAIVSLCDAVTVSTVPLKDKIEERLLSVHGKCPPIYVIPNANDIKDWDFVPVEKKLVIGYAGGLSHHDDLMMVLPSIKKVLEKYPDVGFQMIGQMDLKKAKQVFGLWPQEIRKRVVLLNATTTQPEYPSWLALQPWSIGIAPLISSPFNESKSHIKWMEYSMYQIPTVASRVYPYYKDILGRPTIEHGETGMLCNDDEWVETLSKLIEDEKLRKELGKNAYESVVKNWQYEGLKEHITKITNDILR